MAAWQRRSRSRRAAISAAEKTNPPYAEAARDSGLQIADVYNGGAAFVTFLAAQFSENIHARLLRDDSPIFVAALENQTKLGSRELFAKFQAWLAAPMPAVRLVYTSSSTED